MKRTRKQTSYWFATVATIILIGGGVAIAVHKSSLLSLRYRAIDHFIAQAKEAKREGNDKQKFAYLNLARMVGSGDGLATRITANEYMSIGRYDLAEQTLVSESPTPNYSLAGQAALKAQHYPEAEHYFTMAVKQNNNSYDQAGLSKAMISRGKVKTGCAKNADVIKNNLANSQAVGLGKVCEVILKGGSLTRQQAHQIADWSLYGPAEKYVLGQEQKLARDWLMLAQIAAARGDTVKAIERINLAIELDDTDPKISQFAKKIYQARLDSLSDKDKAYTDIKNRLVKLNTKFQHIPSY